MEDEFNAKMHPDYCLRTVYLSNASLIATMCQGGRGDVYGISIVSVMHIA